MALGKVLTLGAILVFTISEIAAADTWSRTLGGGWRSNSGTTLSPTLGGGMRSSDGTTCSRTLGGGMRCD